MLRKIRILLSQSKAKDDFFLKVPDQICGAKTSLSQNSFQSLKPNLAITKYIFTVSEPSAGGGRDVQSKS